MTIKRTEPSLAFLRKRAKLLGVVIEADRDDAGWGYWLLDPNTCEGVWADDNFSTSRNEVDGKLNEIAREMRGVHYHS
jgi:hypothetical protein